MSAWLVWAEDEVVGLTSTEDKAVEAALDHITTSFLVGAEPLSKNFDNVFLECVPIDATEFYKRPWDMLLSREYVLRRRPQLQAEHVRRLALQHQKEEKVASLRQMKVEYERACTLQGISP